MNYSYIRNFKWILKKKLIELRTYGVCNIYHREYNQKTYITDRKMLQKKNWLNAKEICNHKSLKDRKNNVYTADRSYNVLIIIQWHHSPSNYQITYSEEQLNFNCRLQEIIP